MSDILTRHGFKVAVMKADAVAPDRREAWVAQKVKEGIDILIPHFPYQPCRTCRIQQQNYLM